MIFAIKTAKVMAVVEMESLFSTPIPSPETAHKMINITEHFATDFQEFKVSTAESINKIEPLIWENVMGHDTVQTEYMKQQV